MEESKSTTRLQKQEQEHPQEVFFVGSVSRGIRNIQEDIFVGSVLLLDRYDTVQGK